MNQWLKKIRMKAILPAAALIAAAAIGSTFAWQTWDLSITNELKSHTTKVIIEEEFDDKEDPFDHKIVKFKNNGTSSVFLRVSYTDFWQKGNEILSNQKDGVDIAKKHWANLENQWDYIDGWYYYKKILKKKDSTEEILTKVDPPNPYPKEYIGAEYHLYFKAEVVQCSDGSNTLNSKDVNDTATMQMFGRSPIDVDFETGVVTWKEKEGNEAFK